MVYSIAYYVKKNTIDEDGCQAGTWQRQVQEVCLRDRYLRKAFLILLLIPTKCYQPWQIASAYAYNGWMKLSSYAKKLGVHYNRAYRMFKPGQIAGHQLPAGTVIIEEPVEKAAVQKDRGYIVDVYARVSSSGNKKNIDTQA
jgi:hypothetical protein